MAMIGNSGSADSIACNLVGPRLSLAASIPSRYQVELRQLRYFAAVARERNFTRAAEMLHIAQPPLSRQIQQLEGGVTLIERGSRPLRLTGAGRLIYDQAVQVLERVEEMRAITQRLREAEQPRLRIGFVPSTLYGRLPELMRLCRAVRPGVEFILLELTTLEQIAALKEGPIDVGYGRVPFDDPAIERVLLRNEKLSHALPTRHLLLARRTAAAGRSGCRAARCLPEITAPELRRPGALIARSNAFCRRETLRERGVRTAVSGYCYSSCSRMHLSYLIAGRCVSPWRVAQDHGCDAWRASESFSYLTRLIANHRPAEDDLIADDLQLHRRCSRRQKAKHHQQDEESSGPLSDYH
jgi:DNA-binding transcriptional LysR family regulator